MRGRRKQRLTLDFQVSGAFGVGGSKNHLTGVRNFAVVQDQSVFGPILHDLNFLHIGPQISGSQQKNKFKKAFKRNVSKAAIDSLSSPQILKMI